MSKLEQIIEQIILDLECSDYDNYSFQQRYNCLVEAFVKMYKNCDSSAYNLLANCYTEQISNNNWCPKSKQKTLEIFKLILKRSQLIIFQ